MPVPLDRDAPNRLGACLLLAAIASSVACGSGTDDDGGSNLPPTATIGAGEIDFAPLEVGSTASVILGPQGGYHIIGSVRVTGIRPGDPGDLNAFDNPTTRFTVEQGSRRIDAGGAEYTQGLDRAGDGTFEMVGRIVILDIVNDDAIEEMMVKFSVEVTDVDGVRVADTIELIARADPRNP